MSLLFIELDYALHQRTGGTRQSGEMTGDPKAFGQKDAYAFANQLNAFLTKHYK